MTDRDLGALLERASEHLPEVDFAQGAWAAAVEARARRRRLVVGTLGAVAAAGLAVTAVQLGGSTEPRPTPATSSTSRANAGTLSDGTAYAVMPLEGTETQLPVFDAGLPSVIELRAKTTNLSSTTVPLASAVAVYLRVEGSGFRPVLVQRGGKQFVADRVLLAPTNDANGNAATPLGPRAFGGGGRYIVFPQRDHVVRLDTQTGDTTSYAVPSEHVEWAGWTAGGDTIVARDAEHAWTIDPTKPGGGVVAVGGGYDGKVRLAATADTRSLWIGRYDESGSLTGQRSVTGPVVDLAGETVSSGQWAAAGAYFDQNLTSTVIQRGNGPIYQGLVAVESDRGKPRLLLAPENPDGQTGRFKGCCTPLGWADSTTLLYQSVGSHGRWILAWNVTTGTVYDVSRLTTGAPDDPPTAIALNVGTRS